MNMQSPTTGLERPPEEEVVRSWAGGAIKIVKKYDLDLDREVEYAEVLGVRIPRRDPKNDHYPGNPDQKLPGFNGDPGEFEALTFNKPDIELLQASMMRNAIGHHTDFRGYPGHGKSTMIYFLAYLLNVPFRKVSCKKGMKVVQEFLWKFAKNGEWDGRLGPLPLSMQDGGILLIDEFANLEPHERQLILEPTESPNNVEVFKKVPTLTIQDFPGEETTVTSAPGFMIIATGNYSFGSGAGEIAQHSEREERRVRPYLLGKLPAGTKASRLAGRYLRPEDKETSTFPEGMKRTEYYPNRLNIPANILKIIANFFEKVEEAVEAEVLGQKIAQDPKVYLTEAIDRAFDHFMRFQIMKNGGVKEGDKSWEAFETREAEIIDSLIAALEFYYLNSFRENTMMTVPNEVLVQIKQDIPRAINENNRIAVRTYLSWRFKNIFESAKLFKHANTVVSTKERLNKALMEAMGVEPPPQDEDIPPEEMGIGEWQEKIRNLMGSALEDADLGKLENLVNAQYEGAINLLQVSGLYDSAENTHPSKERVKELLRTGISPEQMEVIGKMEKPVLQIVPNRTCAEYETALNRNKPMVNRRGQSQVDANVTDWMKQAFERADTRDNAETGKITGWKVVITEGCNAPTLLDGDNKEKTLAERCEWFKQEFKNKGVSGIDIKGYMLLMMVGFLKDPPRPVDDIVGSDSTWTMLNAEEISNGLGAGGYWGAGNRRVDLAGAPTADQYNNARFRASVVVDVPGS